MRRKLLITGIVVGGLLFLGPVFGYLGTLFNMMGAFQDLSGSGISDPRALSAHIGNTLLATVLGVIACPIGLVLLVPCIVLFVRDKKQLPPPIPSEL
ncbi:hypothetical protein CfE428DRAFT_6662 [Chthoniobacter flavus Ellin428]|uniref:MotA/TolQ/ExbB proton channel domain-containing protein n=1 Tax=Chthoniobacter flavus Ellin428 TaxID=497964 RepID=B4DCM1_9BACT|nr:MotA/TolQ/ExbB proton channel family protein [Chthoniobacter flavus]EDY15809.1 hypothetical protein CfE428DRAFT_6662 [Chthoniobacter flavus Ellin428]TCO84240.1 MotA/TolQ/ExbB proton channel family protein [Chthoniobacter flavus]